MHALVLSFPFLVLQHKQQEADALKKRLAGNTRSDHIALLRAYQVSYSELCSPSKMSETFYSMHAVHTTSGTVYTLIAMVRANKTILRYKKVHWFQE